MSAEHKMGLSGVTIEKLPTTHEDIRRSFVEIFDTANVHLRRKPIKIGDIRIMDIKHPADGREIVVGGHWEQGAELIWVLEGEISKLKLADVNTGEEAIFEHIGTGTR